MATEKLDTTFYEETEIKKGTMSFLNLFNLLKDDEGNKFINIFRSYILNEDVQNSTNFYNTYEVENEDWWELISYRIYDNVFIWWIVAIMNDVVNPFEELNSGDNIKFLREDYIYQLMREVRDIGEL